MTAELTRKVHSRDGLSALRHDLRNPLSEIIGFAEVLVEEVRGNTQLLGGLESIRQTAQHILAEVNHGLNPDTVRSNPAVLASLNEVVPKYAGQILEQSQFLSDRCDELGQTAACEDLLRITGAARRLRDTGSVELRNLISGGIDAAPLAPEIGDDSTESSPAPAVQKSGSILVVDDQESNRVLLARRLRKRGYAVSVAENGRQALERLRQRRFDLVLLDIVMPEVDGLDVLRIVKSDPQLMHIPILMLSAVDELSAVVRCIELGAADYLPKPFPSVVLYARVESSLANKRMSDQLRRYTGWLFGKALFADALNERAFNDLSRTERTVLFADIRGFTAWAERHPPEQVVALLNRYFESAERVWEGAPVIKCEYTGDEIMAIFPTAEAGAQIAEALRVTLNAQLDEVGLAIGIGLHTGPLIEGVVGGSEVKAYRFVGDTVNVAKRISSAAQGGEVLLSDSTFRQLDQTCAVGPPAETQVRGKSEPLKIWPLLPRRSIEP